MNHMQDDLINVKNLIAKLPRYFDGSFETIVMEMIQNATRAQASKLSIRTDAIYSTSGGKENAEHLTVTFTDDGTGIEDIIEAISVANSNWDEFILDSQDPAGMGLYSLYSISDQIEISSRFGSIRILPATFFTSKAYRMSLRSEINPGGKRRTGTEIKAVINREAMPDILNTPLSFILKQNRGDHDKSIRFGSQSYEKKHDESDSEYWFNRYGRYRIDKMRPNIDLEFILGGETDRKIRMKGFSMESLLADSDNRYLVSSSFEGNAVAVRSMRLERNCDHPILTVRYHGHPIICDPMDIMNTDGYNDVRKLMRNFPLDITMDITSGSPVTPVLPSRKELVYDAKMDNLRAFLRDEYLKYFSFIASTDESLIRSVRETSLPSDSFPYINSLLPDSQKIMMCFEVESAHGRPLYMFRKHLGDGRRVMTVSSYEVSYSPDNVSSIDLSHFNSDADPYVEWSLSGDIFPGFLLYDRITTGGEEDSNIAGCGMRFLLPGDDMSIKYTYYDSAEITFAFGDFAIELTDEEGEYIYSSVKASEILGDAPGEILFTFMDEESYEAHVLIYFRDCMTDENRRIRIITHMEDEMFNRYIYSDDYDTYDTQIYHFNESFGKWIDTIRNGVSMSSIVSLFRPLDVDIRKGSSIRLDENTITVTGPEGEVRVVNLLL